MPKLQIQHWIMLLVVACSLTGCSLYRYDLRQGNYVTEDKLNQLSTGMTRHQVQQIMGTPALTPMLNVEQWNYSYAFVDGRHRDQLLKFKTISLYFNGDRLQSYSSSDWHPQNLPKKK